jgi:hypothetical protein
MTAMHYSYQDLFLMFNVTFYNISVKSWRSVLLVEETGVPGENHSQISSYNVVPPIPSHEQGSNSQLYARNKGRLYGCDSVNVQIMFMLKSFI